MQNTTFLLLLKPIFALKVKIAPPPGIGIGNVNVSTLTLVLKRIRTQKSIAAWVRTFSFSFHLISGGKTVPILSEDRFSLVFISETAPPPIANFCLRA